MDFSQSATRPTFPDLIKKDITVFAPASVANVACGFDVLGFALEKPGDEIVVRFAPQKGLSISKITGGKLPYSPEKNTAGFAAIKLLEFLGESDLGIEMEIHKKMPFGSGLGSSAASAAGAVVAINELLGKPLPKFDLLRFAVLGESIASGAIHADNVAPSLLGGFTLVRDSDLCDVQTIPVPKGLCAAVVYPKVEILTKEARSMLKTEVPLKSMVKQTANIASFVLGMVKNDFALIKRALHDVIIEPQRAPLIPHFYDVKNAADTEGVLGCSISGSGPSIFALCIDLNIAQKVGNSMRDIYLNNGIECELFISAVNMEGVKVI
ncbi:MAG: homoserine kinase [Saprospiraceae bacterium]|nr:homoserine kinase [Saprospiraceae bacterium]